MPTIPRCSNKIDLGDLFRYKFCLHGLLGLPVKRIIQFKRHKSFIDCILSRGKLTYKDTEETFFQNSCCIGIEHSNSSRYS